MLYGIPRVLSRVVAVLLLPIYVRVLTAEQLGIAIAALAVGTICAIAIAPATNVYLRFMVRDDGASATAAVAAIHLAVLIVGGTGLILFAEPISGLLMPGIPITPFYYVIVTSTILTTLLTPVETQWRAQHRAGRVAVLELIQMVTSVVTILVSLLWLRWGPVSILLGDLAGSIVLLPVSLPVFGRLLSVRWTRRDLREVLPLIGVAFPMTLYGYVFMSLDRLLILRFMGSGAVATYGVGYQIGAVVTMSSTIMNKEWQPLIFRFAARAEQTPALQGLWIRSICLFFVLGGVVAIGARNIVTWMAGSDYLGSAAIVPWVAATGVLRIPRLFLLNLSLAYGRAQDLFVETLLSLATFGAASLLLIPRWGGVGAAWAGVLATTVGCVFLYSRSWNVFRLDRALLAPAAACAAGVWLGGAVGGTWLSYLILLAALAGLGYEASRYWVFLGMLRPVEART